MPLLALLKAGFRWLKEDKEAVEFAEALQEPRIPPDYGPYGRYGPAAINAQNAAIDAVYRAQMAAYDRAEYGGYGGYGVPQTYSSVINPYTPQPMYGPPRGTGGGGNGFIGAAMSMMAAANRGAGMGGMGGMGGMNNMRRQMPVKPKYVKPPKLYDRHFKRVWVQVPPPPKGTRVLLTDAPIMGTNHRARVHIDLPRPRLQGHSEEAPAVAGPSGTWRSEARASEASAISEVYLPPAEEVSNPGPVPGDQDYIKIADLQYPPKRWRPAHKKQRRKVYPDKNFGVDMRYHRQNKADEFDPPELVPIPLGPRLIARRLPSTEGRSSRLSQMVDEMDGPNDPISPPGRTNSPTVAEAVAARPPVDLSPNDEMTAWQRFPHPEQPGNVSLRPSTERSAARESKRVRFKRLFQPIIKEGSFTPPMSEAEPNPEPEPEPEPELVPEPVVVNKHIERPPEIAIIHTRRRLIGRDTPLTAEHSELSQAVAASQLPPPPIPEPGPVTDQEMAKDKGKGKRVRINTSSESSLRPTNARSTCSPDPAAGASRGTLIPADFLPLPKAVEALRPKHRREVTDPGRSTTPAVSSPLASEPPMTSPAADSDFSTSKTAIVDFAESAGSPGEDTIAELGAPKPDPPEPFVDRPIHPDTPTLPKVLMEKGLIKTPPTSPRLVPISPRLPPSAHHRTQAPDTVRTVIEQPWADLIALPSGSKVEAFNPLRELNKLYFPDNRQYNGTKRVVALPKHVRIPGTKMNTWRPGGIPGTERGPPLRVVELPEELEVEYYEMRMVQRRLRGASVFMALFGIMMTILPFLVWRVVLARSEGDTL